MMPDGVAVTRLTLDQKILGSNPSPAANENPVVELIGLEQATLVRAFAEHTEPPHEGSVGQCATRRPGKALRLHFSG
jgi:hypothetical protein